MSRNVDPFKILTLAGFNAVERCIATSLRFDAIDAFNAVWNNTTDKPGSRVAKVCAFTNAAFNYSLSRHRSPGQAAGSAAQGRWPNYSEQMSAFADAAESGQLRWASTAVRMKAMVVVGLAAPPPGPLSYFARPAPAPPTVSLAPPVHATPSTRTAAPPHPPPIPTDSDDEDEADAGHDELDAHLSFQDLAAAEEELLDEAGNFNELDDYQDKIFHTRRVDEQLEVKFGGFATYATKPIIKETFVMPKTKQQALDLILSHSIKYALDRCCATDDEKARAGLTKVLNIFFDAMETRKVILWSILHRLPDKVDVINFFDLLPHFDGRLDRNMVVCYLKYLGLSSDQVRLLSKSRNPNTRERFEYWMAHIGDAVEGELVEWLQEQGYTVRVPADVEGTATHVGVSNDLGLDARAPIGRDLTERTEMYQKKDDDEPAHSARCIVAAALTDADTRRTLRTATKARDIHNPLTYRPVFDCSNNGTISGIDLLDMKHWSEIFFAANLDSATSTEIKAPGQDQLQEFRALSELHHPDMIAVFNKLIELLASGKITFLDVAILFDSPGTFNGDLGLLGSLKGQVFLKGIRLLMGDNFIVLTSTFAEAKLAGATVRVFFLDLHNDAKGYDDPYDHPPEKCADHLRCVLFDDDDSIARAASPRYSRVRVLVATCAASDKVVAELVGRSDVELVGAEMATGIFTALTKGPNPHLLLFTSFAPLLAAPRYIVNREAMQSAITALLAAALDIGTKVQELLDTSDQKTLENVRRLLKKETEDPSSLLSYSLFIYGAFHTLTEHSPRATSFPSVLAGLDKLRLTVAPSDWSSLLYLQVLGFSEQVDDWDKWVATLAAQPHHKNRILVPGVGKEFKVTTTWDSGVETSFVRSDAFIVYEASKSSRGITSIRLRQLGTPSRGRLGVVNHSHAYRFFFLSLVANSVFCPRRSHNEVMSIVLDIHPSSQCLGIRLARSAQPDWLRDAKGGLVGLTGSAEAASCLGPANLIKPPRVILDSQQAERVYRFIVKNPRYSATALDALAKEMGITIDRMRNFAHRAPNTLRFQKWKATSELFPPPTLSDLFRAQTPTDSSSGVRVSTAQGGACGPSAAAVPIIVIPDSPPDVPPPASTLSDLPRLRLFPALMDGDKDLDDLEAELAAAELEETRNAERERQITRQLRSARRHREAGESELERLNSYLYSRGEPAVEVDGEEHEEEWGSDLDEAEIMGGEVTGRPTMMDIVEEEDLYS